MSKIVHAMGNPLVSEVEATALFHALEWINQMKLQNVIVESNCKQVIEDLSFCIYKMLLSSVLLWPNVEPCLKCLCFMLVTKFMSFCHHVLIPLL